MRHSDMRPRVGDGRLAGALLALLVASLGSAPARAQVCGGAVDCPIAPMPFALPPSNTEIGPFTFDFGALNLPAPPPQSCFNTSGRIAAASVARLEAGANVSEEVQLFTETPAIETLAAGVVTTHALTGDDLHAAGVDCKVAPDTLLASAFAVTDRSIGVVSGGVLQEFLLPVGVLPRSAAGVGSCDGPTIIFSLVVELTDDSLHVVTGGVRQIFQIPAPIVATPDSFSNGPRAGVVVFDANNAHVIEAGIVATVPLIGAYVAHAPLVGGVQVTTTAGAQVIPLAPNADVVPFADCANPILACQPQATIGMNVGPCTSIAAVSAAWPANGAECILPEYHALLVANDEFAGDNDRVEAALLNWENWDERGEITKRDDLTGAQIVAEIEAWAQDVDADDVALFYYSGSSGIRPDFGPDDRDLAGGDAANMGLDNDETAANPSLTRDVDEAIGRLDGMEMIVAPATDEQISLALSSVPEGATLLAVFDTCYAMGMAGGADDVDKFVDTAVLASCAETQETVGTWTGAALAGIFDGSADDGDDRIDSEEWFDFVSAAVPDTKFVSNLDFNTDRPIFVKLGGAPLNGDPGPAVTRFPGKGEEGSGICSEWDFGDNPDSYRTTLAMDGPRYDEFTLQRLGALTDAEADGQPSDRSDGDDLLQKDDEDAVGFAYDKATMTGTVTVAVRILHPAAKTYRLDAWYDANHNGTFEEPEEHILDSRLPFDGGLGPIPFALGGPGDGGSMTLPAGVHPVVFQTGFDPRQYYWRFRLTFGVPPPVLITHFAEFTGPAPDDASHGEVEDYPPNPQDENNFAEQLHFDGVEAELESGASGSLPAVATWGGGPVAGSAVVFGVAAGDVTFTSGAISGGGTQTVVLTDAAGVASASFTAGATGPVVVQAGIPGTEVLGHAVFQVVPASGCGLGAELVVLVPVLAALELRRTRRRRTPH